MTGLEITLLYLLAAVVGVVLCRSLKLPPMLGYLVVGVVIGPNAMALAENADGVRHLGEFGVVFLMFVIGLEFNVHKLWAMRQHVFGLGILQVLITMVSATALILGMAAYFSYWSVLSWQGALALSGALAMSSTAIVVKLMAERLEVESEHGKRVIGVLLFQDLAVVPLLVLIPALGSSGEQLANALFWAGLKAIALVTLLLTGGQQVLRRWLRVVAQRKSEELFVLNLLLITLGLAWLTELAGLSLALGAFIAGMLISETEFKHQVETDIRPFHDVLLGLFFISIGMMLDWRVVAQHWLQVVLLLLAPTFCKALLVAVLAKALGASSGTSLRTGLYLAQAGEFGFVLLALAHGQRLLPETLLNPILASMVLSMLATPFIVMHSNRIVLKLVASDWMLQSLQMTNIARKSIGTQQHVLICGFGRCGQNLARILEAEGIPYMALDLDPERVQLAARAGHAVEYGDCVRLQSLMAAGLARARAVVITFLDQPTAALKVLDHVQTHAPQVPVIVRTQDDHDLERLQAAGATEVVPESIEGSLMLASHALALVGVPMRRVIRIVQDQRDARYNLLRGYFHGADDHEGGAEAQHERLHSVTLPGAAPTLGMALSDLALEALGVRVISVRRQHGKPLPPEPTLQLQFGDTLVLSGHAHALSLAEQHLLTGKGAEH